MTATGEGWWGDACIAILDATCLIHVVCYERLCGEIALSLRQRHGMDVMVEARRSSLRGLRILIVEDEYFLANDLTRELVGKGAEIVGPANTLERAWGLVDEPIDFALLDINLKGRSIFPIVDELRTRAVPFVFTTGYAGDMIPAEYHDVERWEKPLVVKQLLAAIERA